MSQASFARTIRVEDLVGIANGLGLEIEQPTILAAPPPPFSVSPPCNTAVTAEADGNTPQAAVTNAQAAASIYQCPKGANCGTRQQFVSKIKDNRPRNGGLPWTATVTVKCVAP